MIEYKSVKIYKKDRTFLILSFLYGDFSYKCLDIKASL